MKLGQKFVISVDILDTTTLLKWWRGLGGKRAIPQQKYGKQGENNAYSTTRFIRRSRNRNGLLSKVARHKDTKDYGRNRYILG
jgi:hypothetical protein